METVVCMPTNDGHKYYRAVVDFPNGIMSVYDYPIHGDVSLLSLEMSEQSKQAANIAHNQRKATDVLLANAAMSQLKL